MPPVVIVHDYLTQRGGAERVVLAMVKAFPEAPVYTSVYDPSRTFREFEDVEVRAMAVNHLKPLRAHHRLLFPILAPIFSNLRLRAEVTLCSSSGWAHGVRAMGRKVVYCHNPARWLYQTDQYVGDGRRGIGVAIKVLGPRLRQWDRRQAAGAHRYIATSRTVHARIVANYGIDAEILPPPLNMMPSSELTEPVPNVEPGYFLCVSRLLPYKHVDQVVSAFDILETERLVIVGAGPLARKLRDRQTSRVRMLGQVGDAQLRWLYQNCIALVAASHEDFGLTPLEAAAYGKPSATLAWGGFLDTVRAGSTGVMFERPEPDAIAGAIRELKLRSWDPAVLQARADDYSLARFVKRLREIAEEEVKALRSSRPPADIP